MDQTIRRTAILGKAPGSRLSRHAELLILCARIGFNP